MVKPGGHRRGEVGRGGENAEFGGGIGLLHATSIGAERLKRRLPGAGVTARSAKDCPWRLSIVTSRKRRPVRGLTCNHARADAEIVRFAAHPRGRASVEPLWTGDRGRQETV